MYKLLFMTQAQKDAKKISKSGLGMTKPQSGEISVAQRVSFGNK